MREREGGGGELKSTYYRRSTNVDAVDIFVNASSPPEIQSHRAKSKSLYLVHTGWPSIPVRSSRNALPELWLRVFVDVISRAISQSLSVSLECGYF